MERGHSIPTSSISADNRWRNWYTWSHCRVNTLTMSVTITFMCNLSWFTVNATTGPYCYLCFYFFALKFICCVFTFASSQLSVSLTHSPLCGTSALSQTHTSYYFLFSYMLFFILYSNFLRSLTHTHTHTNTHTHTHTHTRYKSPHHIRTSLWRRPHYSLPVRPNSRQWVRRRGEVEQHQKSLAIQTLTNWKKTRLSQWVWLSLSGLCFFLSLSLSLSSCPPPLSLSVYLC